MTASQEAGSPTVEPIWYSYSGKEYRGKYPAFFDPREINGLVEIESKFTEIKSEIEQFLNGRAISSEPYFNTSLVRGEGVWNVIHLYKWGIRDRAICEMLPLTENALTHIPGFLSAAIARLATETEILPHLGDTSAVVRCHLGLVIPSPLPDCGIEVNGESRSWEVGKWIAFCDAHNHRSWNKTKEQRLVLIVDVLLHDYKESRQNISKNVLSILELQRQQLKYPVLKRMPGINLALIRSINKLRV